MLWNGKLRKIRSQESSPGHLTVLRIVTIGGCPVVIAQWRFNSGVLVWFLSTAGLFCFLCFTSFIKNASISSWDKTILTLAAQTGGWFPSIAGFSSGKTSLFSAERLGYDSSWTSCSCLHSVCVFFKEKGLALVCPVNKTVSGRNASWTLLCLVCSSKHSGPCNLNKWTPTHPPTHPPSVTHYATIHAFSPVLLNQMMIV